MASQSRKIVISGVVFGALKAIGSYFYLLSESDQPYEVAVLWTSSQFLVNTVLGIGIAYLVVKHSDRKRYMAVTMLLCVMTFLTVMFEPSLVA